MAQAATGAFTGGAIAEITGGNFVEGFATGLTVSALNHALHQVIAKPIAMNRMSKTLIDNCIDPNGTPLQEVSSVEHLVGNVDVLARLYETGGNPSFEISDAIGRDLGRYDNPKKTVLLSPKAFSSNLSLAFTVGHELVHATHFHSGLYTRLLQKSSNGVAVAAYSEVLAWRWEQQWGSPGAARQIREYTVKVGGWFNTFERMNR